MTARQFPKTLMRGAMWSEQLCLYEFFKTWTPVGFSNHEFLTLRRFIWRLVKLETKIKCAKCLPANCLQPCFLLNHFEQFFDEIWSFEWNPTFAQNHRYLRSTTASSVLLPFVTPYWSWVALIYSIIFWWIGTSVKCDRVNQKFQKRWNWLSMNKRHLKNTPQPKIGFRQTSNSNLSVCHAVQFWTSSPNFSVSPPYLS